MFERAGFEAAPPLAAALLAGDETDALEVPEMLVDGRERHVERRGERAHRRLLAGEALQDRAPRGVGQRGEDPVEAFLMVKHKLKYQEGGRDVKTFVACYASGPGSYTY